MAYSRPFLFKADTWDSRFFRTSIARLNIDCGKKYGGFKKRFLSTLDSAALDGVKFLVVKLERPIARYEKIVRSCGFRKYGESVDLASSDFKARSRPQAAGIRLRSLRRKDMQVVRKIASDAFRLSYLYRAGFAARPAVDSYHMKWAQNLIKDKSVKTFIADKSGKAIGFVNMKVDRANKLARIVLIAVGKRYRAQGIGSLLMGRCMDWAKGRVTKMYVKTQRDNKAALAAYRKMGFQKAAKDAVFCKKFI